MSAKHTPGPWTVMGDVIVGQPTYIVAGIYNLRASNSEQEEQANAALIAAAPELLEALENLLAAQIDPFGIKAARACKAAVAAISKAKNEQ